MTKRQVSTKTELVADIEQGWTRLNAALDRLTPAQLTTIKDAQGWTVKDHIIHLTHWERSVVFFLQRQPRYRGLGVPETLYWDGSDDDINVVIHEQTSTLPPGEALSQFYETHRQLLKLLEPLTDLDLQKTYREYLPDEPSDGDGPPALDVIYGNTAHHFAEHLGWIEALVSQPGAEE
jgi:hypothetical protein